MTTTSFSHDRLAVPDSVVARAIDGATVLLNVSTGQSFMLDGLGTRVWTVLTAVLSVQQAYETLLQEYSVEPDELRRDLEALVERLAASGLLEIQRA